MKMIMVMKMGMLKILTSSLRRSPEDKCVYRNLPWIFSHWVPFPDPGPPSRNNIGLLLSLWYYEIGQNMMYVLLSCTRKRAIFNNEYHVFLTETLGKNLRKNSQLWDKCWPNVDRAGLFISSSRKPQTWICARLLN